jgi:hypothetical protein
VTIQPGALDEPDTSSLPSIWSLYEKKLCEVKKHVDDQIAGLGFEGVTFQQESIVSQDSNVVINVTFYGGNHKVFESNNFVLVGDRSESLNVQKLTGLLVVQAKIISLGAIKSAVAEAKSITKKNIAFVKEDSNNFVLACFGEKLNESGEALIMEIPKRNVISWSSEIMASEIVKLFQCEDKLEK